MKKVFAGLTAAAAVVAVPLAAPAQNYVYEGVINVPVNAPLPMAADADGGLYTADFNEGGQVIYIADPVAAIGTTDELPAEVGDVIFEVTGWPASRGLQGLQVDSAGNVYVSGDPGGATYIVKLTPAPDFEVDDDFEVAGAIRIGGVALLNDDVIAAAQFGSLYFYDTTTGAQLANVSGGTIYQREPVYNPTDDVFYCIVSGNNSNSLVRGYWSGGAPDNLAGYAFTAEELITDGSWGSPFGGATGNAYYDVANDWFITADNDPEANVRQIRLWVPSAGGTELTLAATIDGSTPDADGDPPAFAIESTRDIVRIGDRLFVSSTDNDGIIYVFIDEDAVVSVGDWSLYH